MKKLSIIWLGLFMTFSVIAQSPVSWKNLLNTSASGNLITKTGGNGWNGTGHSTKKILSGVGGSVEFVMQNKSSTSMWGLNESNTTSSYTDLNYAFYLNWGKVYLIENGSHVLNGSATDITSLNGDDVFKLEVSPSGQVKYYHNDNLLYTSSQIATSDMFADCSIYYTNMEMRADIQTPTITWKNLQNTSVSGPIITKTSGGNGWNGTGHSVEKIYDGVGGSVEFTMQNSSSTSMWGLNESNINSNYTDLNYAFYLNWGKVYLIENGSHVLNGSATDITSLNGDDRFKLEVSPSGQVKYYHNDNLLYTSTQTATSDLFFDCSIYYTGMSMMVYLDAVNPCATPRPKIKPPFNIVSSTTKNIYGGTHSGFDFYIVDYAYPFCSNNTYLLYISSDVDFSTHVTGFNGTDFTGYNGKDIGNSVIQEVTTLPTACGTYYCRVKKSGIEGSSEYSEFQKVVLLGPPSKLPPTTVWNDGFIAKWGSGSCSENVEEFELEVSDDIDFNSVHNGFPVQTSNNSWSVSNLDPNCVYYYRVRAKNGDSFSAWSSPVTVHLKPNSPDPFTTSVSNNEFTINWEPVECASEGYKIEVRVSPDIAHGQIHTATVSDPNANSYVVDISSHSFCGYYYRICAMNYPNSPTLWSDFSEVIPVYMNAGDFWHKQPEIGNDYFIIKWFGSSCTDGYIIEVSEHSNFSQVLTGYPLTLTDFPNGTEHLVSDLSSETCVYYYRVRSFNGTENSDWKARWVNICTGSNGHQSRSTNIEVNINDNTEYQEQDYEIYPNPLNQIVNLKFTQSLNAPLNWVLYDQSGKQVLSGTINYDVDKAEISTDLPSGIYMLHIFNREAEWKPQRLVIIHE